MQGAGLALTGLMLGVRHRVALVSVGRNRGRGGKRIWRSAHSGGDDLFAHFSGIKADGLKPLQENQRASFEVTTGPKGKQAAKIQAA